MSEKRAASNSFGTSQLVKRQKSNAELGGSKAVAVANGNAANGALIQAVSHQLLARLPSQKCVLKYYSKEGRLMRRLD